MCMEILETVCSAAGHKKFKSVSTWKENGAASCYSGFASTTLKEPVHESSQYMFLLLFIDI
jgi:hypothetical protein